MIQSSMKYSYFAEGLVASRSYIVYKSSPETLTFEERANDTFKRKTGGSSCKAFQDLWRERLLELLFQYEGSPRFTWICVVIQKQFKLSTRVDHQQPETFFIRQVQLILDWYVFEDQFDSALYTCVSQTGQVAQWYVIT